MLLCKLIDIDGYDGNYKIDANGSVFSFQRIITTKYGKLLTVNGKLKKATINKDGYATVTLYKNNKPEQCYIHRLVAKYFIPNPYNYSCVNHKNGIKSDNRISNLEWCSYSQNNLHAYRELSKVGYWKSKSENHPNNKKVVQFDLFANKIEIHNSISDCARKIGVKRESIRDNIKGKIKTIQGKYIFKLI